MSLKFTEATTLEDAWTAQRDRLAAATRAFCAALRKCRTIGDFKAPTPCPQAKANPRLAKILPQSTRGSELDKALFEVICAKRELFATAEMIKIGMPDDSESGDRECT